MLGLILEIIIKKSCQVLSYLVYNGTDICVRSRTYEYLGPRLLIVITKCSLTRRAGLNVSLAFYVSARYVSTCVRVSFVYVCARTKEPVSAATYVGQL